jgi:hypothetical protein
MAVVKIQNKGEAIRVRAILLTSLRALFVLAMIAWVAAVSWPG